MKRLQLACLALCLAIGLFLTSCGVLNQVPPDQAIRLAIAQQQTNVRQKISKGLGISEQASSTLKFKIDGLNVASRQKLGESKRLPQGYPENLYKVRGTFSATVNGSTQKMQQEGPF